MQKDRTILLDIIVHKFKEIFSVIKQACIIVSYDCRIITTYNMFVGF